ncbi:peptidoglycan DD-metalloendopeptidase family protein [Thalassotalea sp. M1531]|uniref:Peptidoglycan DD-metalloendopeptidase family protein n=1 Tax=Thalassotalea algicola TaxID=2716224 RepID=A0A7Y0Q5W2_9GAMM|nr:peptidoglycan DD-metalloendopeptidase family protein [Thalassotalea algicola]NMP30531.1 peptidoglycan DD-metalloendopeptidase family protein [Thalassotalea algicola]
MQLIKALLVLTALSSFLSVAQKASDKELSSVQNKIAKQKSAIVKVSKKRRQLNMQLKKDDFAIAKVAKAINGTNKSLKATTKKLTELAKEQLQLKKDKQQQEQALAHQLRTAYTAGQHDYLKMLLNQEQSSQVQRSVTYYQYLNKARIKEIEQFQATIARLETVAQEQQEKAEKLKQFQQTQKKQKLALEKNKTKRKSTLRALRKELLSNKQQLAKLEQEEANLVAALQRLARESSLSANLVGLNKLKRRLRWPVKGKIKHSFGARKQGYLRWKGVLLSSGVGSQVTSIHAGKVLFADWLKGYGLVTVVDHGKGYMSLYGHNQALLKNVGDTVESGEPIALVGQSGGQNEPGLYFEIRHKGKAVNPKIWCK